jgi:hypothetical protein
MRVEMNIFKNYVLNSTYVSVTKVIIFSESCIFAQFLNVGALLVAIVVYIRYKQVHEFLVSHQIGYRSIKVNIVGLYLGWIGAFGISIVANFQETAVFRVHLTGALMAFGVGSAYLWTQVSNYEYIQFIHATKFCDIFSTTVCGPQTVFPFERM